MRHTIEFVAEANYLDTHTALQVAVDNVERFHLFREGDRLYVTTFYVDDFVRAVKAKQDATLPGGSEAVREIHIARQREAWNR